MSFELLRFYIIFYLLSPVLFLWLWHSFKKRNKIYFFLRRHLKKIAFVLMYLVCMSMLIAYPFTAIFDTMGFVFLLTQLHKHYPVEFNHCIR